MPPAAASIDQLLSQPRTSETDIFGLLTALYERDYTGELTLHFKHGIPRKAHLPPAEITLAAGPLAERS